MIWVFIGIAKGKVITLKRAILLLVVLAWLTPGCGSDEQARQRDQAGEDFKVAHTHVENAAAGFIADRKFDSSLGALTDYISQQATPAANTTLEMYQQRELVEAQKKLQPLLTSGTDAQQANAATDLAQTHTMLARMHAQNAMAGWSNESTLTSNTLSTLAAARESHTLAASLTRKDTAEAQAKANRELTKAETAQRTLDKTIQNMQRQRQNLQTQRDAADKLRQEKADAAADRLKRSFEAQGQSRYDLAEQSAGFSRQAHEAATKVDSLENDIDLLDAQIRIASIEQAQNQTDIDTLKGTLDALNAREREMGTEGRKAEATASKNAENLASSLGDRATGHEENIVNQFNKAAEHLDQAIKALQQAQGKAQGDQRTSIKANLAARQAELGLMLSQAVQVDQGYATTLNMIAKQVSQGLPSQQAQQIKQMAEAASNRLEQTTKSAIEALEAAAKTLKDVEDASGEKKTRIAMLNQLVAVYQSLLSVTGDESFADQASSAANALSQLHSE